MHYPPTVANTKKNSLCLYENNFLDIMSQIIIVSTILLGKYKTQCDILCTIWLLLCNT